MTLILLRELWESLNQIMKKGALDPLTKELIYIAVSMTIAVNTGIRSHSAAAKKKGMTKKMLQELLLL